MEQNKIAVPAAIVIAGALIAGALYFSGNNKVDNSVPVNTPSATVPEITVAPVTSPDHILGNPSAPILFVEYSDTECPFCKQFHVTMKKIMENYGKNGKVAWVYRHFPIVQLHPRAPKESEALECANELGGVDAFWKYTDTIYEVTPSNNKLDPDQLPIIAKDIGLNQTLFETCLNSGKYSTAIQQSYDAAVKAGGSGTPYSVLILNKPASASVKNFVASTLAQLRTSNPQIPDDLIFVTADGQKIGMSGALPYEMISKIIDEILKS